MTLAKPTVPVAVPTNLALELLALTKGRILPTDGTVAVFSASSEDMLTIPGPKGTKIVVVVVRLGP